MTLTNHAPHTFSGFSNRCRGYQDQSIKRIAEPVDQTPNPDAMGLAGRLWPGDPKIIPLAGFLKDLFSPRIPLKPILVFLVVIRPEKLNDSSKMAILTKPATLGTIVVPKRNKLDGDIGRTDWPDSAISFKALGQEDRLQNTPILHKFYLK